MLQDLDARQTSAHEASHLYTKPVARSDARVPVPLVAGAAAGVVALAVAGALGWRYWHKPQPVQAPPRPVKVVMLPQPAAKVVPVAPKVEAAPGTTPGDAPVKPTAVAAAETHEPPAPQKRHVKRKPEEQAKSLTPAPQAEAPAKKTKAAKAAEQGKEESAAQKAESSYRRALASLQDGYVNDAIAAFEETLRLNPRHDAARQTLVSLLIENRRADEAMRQLQLGLTLDPRQPAMAMLLARLQIEHGASGIETLMRTLPYAGTNGEYHAFLAGALQRQQRHREAAEQYQAALQGAPQNGVWWMGLGISLQALTRDGEALDAFRRAKGTGTLTPELLSFVERKIQLLGRTGGG